MYIINVRKKYSKNYVEKINNSQFFPTKKTLGKEIFKYVIMGFEDVLLYRYSDLREYLLAPRLAHPTPEERFSWRVHVTNGRLETQHISFSADPNVALFYALTNRENESLRAFFAAARFPRGLLEQESLGVHDCNTRSVWENLRSYDQAAGMYASAHAEVIVDTIPFVAGVEKSLAEYVDDGGMHTCEMHCESPAEAFAGFGVRREEIARLKRVPKFWEFLALLETICSQRETAKSYGEFLEKLYRCRVEDMCTSLDRLLQRPTLPTGSLLPRSWQLLRRVSEAVRGTWSRERGVGMHVQGVRAPCAPCVPCPSLESYVATSARARSSTMWSDKRAQAEERYRRGAPVFVAPPCLSLPPP